MADEPFWMTGNRDGSCAECEDTFNKGDRIVWSPKTYKAYCKICGIDIIGEDKAITEKALEEARKHARHKYQGRSKKPN